MGVSLRFELHLLGIFAILNNRKPKSTSSGSGVISKNGTHPSGTRHLSLTHCFHKKHLKMLSAQALVETELVSKGFLQRFPWLLTHSLLPRDLAR